MELKENLMNWSKYIFGQTLLHLQSSIIFEFAILNIFFVVL